MPCPRNPVLGVIIGGQAGLWVLQRVDPEKLKLFISAVFVVVGVFMPVNVAA